MTPTITIDHLGTRFVLEGFSEHDHITKNIINTKDFYEVELLKYIRQMGINGKTAIDVGANIGNHSLFFGAFIAGRVISIEPNPQLGEILSRNLTRNNIEANIIIKALARTKGSGELYFPIGNNVGAGAIKVGAGDIDITTLDSVAPASGVCLVKIDVEGMEIEVLEGAHNLLVQQHPEIIVEAATDPKLLELKRFLARYGYECLTRWNATPTYHFSHQPGLGFKLKSKMLSLTRNMI